MSVKNYLTNISSVKFNSINISKIYEGTNIVYKSEPFVPGTVIASLTNNQTYEAILPVGKYKIRLTGGGGQAAYSDEMLYYHYWYEAGGGGANFEGIIYNPTQQNIKLYAAAFKGTSYLELGGTRMITCAPGGNGDWFYYQHNSSVIWRHTPGAGGTLTVNNALEVISIETSGNGQAGIETQDIEPARKSGGLSGSTQYWGAGEWRINESVNYVQYGGAYLEYVGQKTASTTIPFAPDVI